jgi:hypothetical protein
MLRGSLPVGVNVMSMPEASKLDFESADTLPNYPLVIISTLIGRPLVNNSDRNSGSVWDIGITCIDVNRSDEPSSHENASTLSDIVFEKLTGFASRQAGAPGIGNIHSVENTQLPSRSITETVGGKQRTEFDSRYSIGMRPSRRSPINT